MGTRKNPDNHKTRWQKGFCPNPNGRPKLPEHLKHIKSLNADEVEKTISLYSRMPMDELAKVLEANTLPAWEQAIARNLYLAATGDLANLNFTLDRTVGKTTDKSEIKVADNRDEDLDTIPRDVLLKLAQNS